MNHADTPVDDWRRESARRQGCNDWTGKSTSTRLSTDWTRESARRQRCNDWTGKSTSTRLSMLIGQVSNDWTGESGWT